MDGKKWKEIREKRKEIRAENEKKCFKKGKSSLKKGKGRQKMGAFGGFSPPKWGRKQKNGQRLRNSFGLGVKPGDFGSNRVEKPRFGSQKRGGGGGNPQI